MADEQIVTNIVATSDFSSLIADVQRTTSALTKLQQELALSNKTLSAQAGQIQKAFGETLRSTGQFTTHFVTVGSEIDRFGKNLDAGKLKLRDYFGTWQQHTKTSGGLIRDLAKQQVALQNAIVQPLGKSADGLMKFNVHVANGIDTTLNKTALARKEMQIYNKVIQDGGVQLINWGKNTQWAGRQLTVGLTVPIAAFGAAAQKAFREADQELVRLTKVYGGLAATSSTELAKVRKDVSDTARELSKSYGSSYKDTIALAADIAATGKQGNELLESTKEATRLSILGEVDRQEAMKATLAIQSAFKQNTDELTESINFLNAVENQTSTSLADLVEAIPKAGPVVKALGGDVQDLALYLTAMREGGINASEGANALKSALASIINPTKVAKDQFMGFGIDLSGIVNKNAGNLTATILGIQAALETLDPLKKSQAIEQLFGKFQFARMNALFENLGKQGSQTLQVLDLMKSSSQDLANVAGRELAQITESASGQYRRAIESLKADLAGLGEQFLRISTFFIKTVDGLVKFINNLPGPLKTVITLLTGFTALAGPLIMLTGVFANFIGYVIKGIGHIRALGRGGEGFKLLTPQILAAEQAGSLIEKTFYSDAQAAGVLQTALSNLTNELTILQQKAASGSISVQPTLSTIQGNVIAESTQRVADPNNPLIGKPYSRQMSHLNPVAGMTNAERAAQTIFGVVPGPGPVNQRIGKNPQIYAEGDLPKIEGVTSIKGVSTGIVAQEAAKWHSMTAALAMQSKEEIALLKREVAATGTVTTELSTSYQALLPQMTGITTMAAQEAKLIVAQLQAGKVTVDQARAKIIALNAQVEAMMAQTAAQVATTQGKVLNVSAVPLTGQPVVDPTSGKTNMKEMFHKSKTSALVDKIARSLGVRTSGGGYSTHTTIPKRFKDGDIVPGPNVNADVVPALLTPGEFVVRRDAVTPETLPILREINGPGTNSPRQNLGSRDPLSSYMQGITPEEMSRLAPDRFNPRPNARIPSYRVRGTSVVYMGAVTDPNIISKYPDLSKDGKTITLSQLNKSLESGGLPPEVYRAAMKSSPEKFTGSTDQLLTSLKREGIISQGEFDSTKQRIDIEYDRYLRSTRFSGVRNPNGGYPGGMTDDKNRYWELSNRIINESLEGNKKALGFWNKFSSVPAYIASDTRRSPSMQLKEIEFEGQKIGIGRLRGRRGQSFAAHTRTPTPLLREMERLSIGKVPSLFRSANLPRGRFVPRARFSQGGMVGGMPARYGMGGMVGGMPARGYNRGGQVTSQLGMMAGSIGGSMLGSAVAGPIGQMVGSIAGGFLPQLLGMLRSRELMSAAQIFSRTNIAIGGTVAALGLAYSAYKKHNEQVRLTALGYGLTEEAASKAGMSYKNLSDSLKTAIQNSKDLAERNKLVYESLAGSRTPLNITIEQYKKLKEEIKSTMPDLIKLVNITKTSELGDLGERLKAQFVSAGMSADEATKKIYTLISLSNKSGMAGSVISTTGFRQVTDPMSAAVSSVQQLNKQTEIKQSANQTVSVIKAINAGIEDAVKKGAEYSVAVTNQLDAINRQVKNQKTLTTEVITNIEKQVPEMRNILNVTDTGTTAWAKYQLMIQGVTEDLDKMSGAAAIALQKANVEIQKAVRITLTGKGGSLEREQKQLKAYNDQIAKLEQQAKGQSVQSQINAKEEIKAINKKIDAINKEYDARKKALSLQQQTEDVNIAIQKAQLEYQNALASGDMASAAQAQLNIRGIVGQRQNQLAQDALETARQAKIKPLEDRKDALSEAQDKIANSASLASSKLDELKKAAENLKIAMESVITARSTIELGLSRDENYLSTKEGKTALAAYYQAESVNNPDNPNLKNVPKYGAYTTGTGAIVRNPVALGRQLFGMESGINLSAAGKKASSDYRNAPGVPAVIDSLYNAPSRGIYSSDLFAQGWGSPSIKKPTSAKFDIPKNAYAYTPGSTSTTNNSGGNTYNATVILNGSNMSPQETATAVLKEFEKLNIKSGRSRSK
jgi:TP901 family phage tail tape measure protein